MIEILDIQCVSFHKNISILILDPLRVIKYLCKVSNFFQMGWTFMNIECRVQGRKFNDAKDEYHVEPARNGF